MAKYIHFFTFTLLVGSVLLFYPHLAQANSADQLTINAFAESGPLHMNGAGGTVEKVENAQKIIYKLPPGAIIGSWNRDNNKTITRANADFINIAAVLDAPGQYRDIKITVELKGDKGIENLSVPYQGKSFQIKELINWQLIGNFKELIFLIHNQNSKKAINGVITVKLSFTKLSYFEKLSLALSGRFILLTVLSITLAILFYILGIFFCGKKLPENHHLNPFLKDILLALSFTLLLGITFATYALGDLLPMERGKILYLIPFISVLISALLKFIFTGRLTTLFETFRNAFFPGLLAITTSSATTWLRPSSWTELVTVGCFGAATFVFLYHIANSYRLGSVKKHLGFAGAFFLTSVPYLFGLLLALQNRSLFIGFINFESGWLKTLADFTSLPPAYLINITAAIASFIVIFFFTEFTCNAFAILNGKRLLIDRNAHKKIAILSLGLVIAPFIADIGSGDFAGNLPVLLRSALAILSTVIAQGMLWAFVFMITGIMLDAIRGEVPAAHTIHNHARKGRNNGMMFSGILMAIIQGIYLFCHAGFTHRFYEIATFPLLMLCGAVLFPLIKTIIETFDGSHAFLTRARESYKRAILYARGTIVGLALALAITIKISDSSTATRILFGVIAGALAFGGISFIMEQLFRGDSNSESDKNWRSYLLEAGMGAFIGAALCFYLDSNQISVIISRFNAYNRFATTPQAYSFNNLVSAWGHISLSDVRGGSKLLYNQALNGVIAWGVAAWLFAINKALLNALFSRDVIYIKRIGTRAGIIELAEGTIRVLRWGLWMSPIIFTFLKQMDVATWYNQDGAIRTVFATANNLTMTPARFHDWSLNVFMWVMAYDFFRILIWMDHMGLRVASLVNLSFIGMESLDSRFVRFVNRSGSAIKNVIPEGVQRFMTWAPLLIPYYIPAAGTDWDYAWNRSVEIQSATPAYIATIFKDRWDIIMISSLSFFVLLALFLLIKRRRRSHALTLSNTQYKLGINKKTGAIRTAMFAIHCNIDVTRRSYGKKLANTPMLYLFDNTTSDKFKQYQLFGEFDDADKNRVITREADYLKISGQNDIVKYAINFSIPVKSDQVAFIDIVLENITDSKRKLKLVPYFEWALDSPSADRARITENRQSQEMLIEPGSNAIYCIQPTTGVVGFIASEIAPTGYLKQQSDFIADNGEINFNEAKFRQALKSREWVADPAGALLLELELVPGEIKNIRLITGCAFYEAEAVNFVKSYLKPRI